MDFRPISLCNVVYKVISKLITRRITASLSLHISYEQTSFLSDSLIHDVVATAQEVLYSIHLKNLDVAIIKIDLFKA